MSHPEADALTAQVVADYLRDHPDFFHHHQDLVARLSIPHREQGAVSLVEVQLKRQRVRIEELEEEITQLMSLAANNDRTFHDFMQLQEQVLGCEQLSDVVAYVEQTARSLGLKGYLKLFDAPNNANKLNRENYSRFATNHLNGKEAFLGRMKSADRELLFAGQKVPELGSFAVLPIIRKKPRGVVAFSSDDGGHFQPNLDTLFLRHLTLVLGQLVEHLPWHKESEAHVVCTSA